MAPRIGTVPLPPVAPYSVESTFPGDGNDRHQSAQRTDNSDQEAELSSSLATAKPKDIENETQSGVSEFFYPAEDRAL
jgi:hypothetical protein